MNYFTSSREFGLFTCEKVYNCTYKTFQTTDLVSTYSVSSLDSEGLPSTLLFLLRNPPPPIMLRLCFSSLGFLRGGSYWRVSCSCQEVKQLTSWGWDSRKQLLRRYALSPSLTRSREQNCESRLLLTWTQVSELGRFSCQLSFFFWKNSFSIICFRMLRWHFTITGSLTIVQNQNHGQSMNSNPSMAEHAQVSLPPSTVRTISLQKHRPSSPLTPHHPNLPTASPHAQPVQHSKKLYEKMLDRKIGANPLESENRQKLGWNGRQIISKKFQQLRRQTDKQQMKQCTFKPSINPSEKNNRTVNKFFNDQLQHNQNKNDKIEEMRIILEGNRQKQATFRPNAMLGRQKKQGNLNSGQVYDRLYQDSKDKDKNSVMSRQQSSQTIRKNSITSSQRFKGISRGNSSQNLNKNSHRKASMPVSLTNNQLHKQSMNSENMSSQLSCNTSRKGSTELSSKGEILMERPRRESKVKGAIKRVDVNILEKDNSKNEEIYIRKIMKEMAVVIQRCSLPLVFSYMEMSLFLEKMNFLASSASNRRILYQIWNMLQGEIYQQVSALSVMKIVYAIMGCHNVGLVNKAINQFWLADSSSVNQQEQQLKQLGKQLSFKQNLLMLSQRDSKTVRQSYEELYLNRMKDGESELLKGPRPDSFSFRPSISKASEEYAERYRNRMLSETERLMAENKISYLVPKNGEIDHVDFLLLDQMRKEVVMQQKRENRQKEKRKEEDQSLIGPNATERESNRSSRSVLNQRDRNRQLYEMGKHANQGKKDRTANEIEEEKWKNELTFKPVLKAKQNILQQLNSKNTFIPDYDKTVYRMQEARKYKDPSSLPKHQDDSPLLYLNVVMEGSQSVKVPVYRDDSLRSITEKVRSMMGLEGDHGKLQEILKMQIMPALKEMNLSCLVEN